VSGFDNDVRGGSYAATVETQATPVPHDAAGEDEAEARFAVVIQLNNGERIEAEAFDTEPEAHDRAERFVTDLGQGRWPLVMQRYLRPDAVVTVDVVRDEQPRWTGSTGRATSWTGRTGV
jgi:hypothetical protein